MCLDKSCPTTAHGSIDVHGKVLRADRRTERIVAQVPGSFRAADLAVGVEGVWVYDQQQGAVLRIDPGTNRVVRTIPVISQPLVELYSSVLALGDGAIWVVDKGGEAVVRLRPEPLSLNGRAFGRHPAALRPQLSSALVTARPPGAPGVC
jgi:streptogramin lyase